MGLEQEIQQTTFRNEYHKVLMNIVFTSNVVLEKMKQLLESEDITHQQYNILRILRSSGKPLSTLQIRERMLDKMSDTSRIVERLLKKELVNKTPCSHDKRLVDITISNKGLDLLEELDKQNMNIDTIAANISTTEAETLNRLLDKLRVKADL
jgi:DNA-binding MarR family transcriptional regulator